MAERVVIEVSERGSRVVRERLAGIGRTAVASSGGVDILRRGLALIGGAVLIRGLVRTSDQFTNMTNRLKLVTEGTEDLVAVTEELGRISADTRTSLTANAELFTRTALATKELGLSQKQTLEFTEALSKATILSGASTIEATNAIRQLTQGLASGQLRGEEFRAVSEQLPLVLEILSEDLNITRGALREMAFEGKLTADVLVNALLKAAEDLDEQFKETTPTISQAFEVIRTEITLFVGEANRASGAAEAFARGLIFLSKNIETVARLLGAAVLAGAISKIISLVRSLTLALATNPFGILITAIALATAGLVAFSDQIKLTDDGLVTFADFAIETAKAFQDIFVVAFQNASEVLNAFTGNLTIAATNGEGTLLTFIRSVARSIDFLGGLFKGLSNFIVTAFADLPKALANIFVAAFNGVLKIVEGAAQKIIDIINPILTFARLEPLVSASVGQLELPFKESAIKLGQSFNDGFKEGVGAEDLVDSIKLAGEARAQLRQSEAQLTEFRQSQARDRADTGGAILGADLNQTRTVLEGFSDGLVKITKEVTDFGTLAETTLVNAFNGAEDALVDFVTTGEADFKGFVDSVLADLTRLLARQALVGLIGALTGGGAAGGGLASIAGSLGPGRAAGGPVGPGRAFPVGERGPELFVPNTSGMIVPNGAAAAQPAPVINVINVSDPNEVEAEINSGKNDNAFINMVGRNRDAMNNQLS